MGPTWSPPGADRTQVVPVLATWTLLSGNVSNLVRAPPNFWMIGVVFSYPCKTHLLVSTYKTPCRCLCIFTQPHLNSLNSVKICFISSNMLAEMSSFLIKTRLHDWICYVGKLFTQPATYPPPAHFLSCFLLQGHSCMQTVAGELWLRKLTWLQLLPSLKLGRVFHFTCF